MFGIGTTPKRAPQDSASAQLKFCGNGGTKCPHCNAPLTRGNIAINEAKNALRVLCKCTSKTCGKEIAGVYTISHFEG